MPEPKANETEREYISRCEMYMHEENEGRAEGEKRTNEQMSAICYSTWRKHKAK